VGSSTQRTLPPQNAFSASCRHVQVSRLICVAEVVVPPQVPVAWIIVGGAAALLIDRIAILGVLMSGAN
jgi:hypothetical protein